MMSDSLARNRFNVLLMSIFAGAAVLMAVVGLYGVLSYSVARRSNEIGIRMALGAGAGEVIRQVLGEGGRLIGIGLLVGAGGAAALTGLLSTLIYGVDPIDPVSFASGILLLAVTALVASLIPALRAARVDPMVALRNE
jgi:putative ABC transport system permease protein